jgi:TRAP-type C4-dicarboxylate transport system substrate-binding protein
VEREAREAVTRPEPERGKDMTSPRIRMVALLLATLALATPSQAQSVALRLATILPDGSVWDKNLDQMASEWSQASGGRVTLTVFPGGAQGDESSVIRKMRLDSLQAASLTVVGLGSLDGSFNVFNMPFFFNGYEELNAVVEALTPTLKQRLDSKGFVLLNWGHGGWLQVFSKKPIRTLADLKAARLWTSAGGDGLVEWYKANGFQPRALAMTDILTGLTAGMIDAIPTPPMGALAFQWNRQAPFMLDIGLMPVVGATVVSKKAWSRIPEADRVKLLASAQAVEKRLQMEVPNGDKLAIGLMSAQGLTVTRPEGPEWEAVAGRLADTMRGSMVPPDMFDLALKARDAYRRQRKPAAAR